jgi:hypothetical protein
MQSHDPEPKVIQWEQPIGVVRGLLSEPGLRFVDPHVKEEREAIQEEGKRPDAVRNRQ